MYLIRGPPEQLPDVGEETVLDGDEGGRHLEGVDVGVEGVAEPGARQPVLVHPVVQLVVEVRVTGLHRVLHHRLRLAAKCNTYNSIN